MICANCGREVARATTVQGLILCGVCMGQMKDTEQVPQSKIVSPNFRRLARRRHYTREWR